MHVFRGLEVMMTWTRGNLKSPIFLGRILLIAYCIGNLCYTRIQHSLHHRHFGHHNIQVSFVYSFCTDILDVGTAIIAIHVLCIYGTYIFINFFSFLSNACTNLDGFSLGASGVTTSWIYRRLSIPWPFSQHFSTRSKF